MGRPQVSFTKRQREQAKRDKRLQKAEKKAQRLSDPTRAEESEFDTPHQMQEVDSIDLLDASADENPSA